MATNKMTTLKQLVLRQQLTGEDDWTLISEWFVQNDMALEGIKMISKNYLWKNIRGKKKEMSKFEQGKPLTEQKVTKTYNEAILEVKINKLQFECQNLVKSADEMCNLLTALRNNLEFPKGCGFSADFINCIVSNYLYTRKEAQQEIYNDEYKLKISDKEE